MTMIIILYIATWANIIYAIVTAPTAIELWGEEID